MVASVRTSSARTQDLRVDAPQDIDAVPCPFRHLGRRDVGAQPQRDRCLSEVVWGYEHAERLPIQIELAKAAIQRRAPDAQGGRGPCLVPLVFVQRPADCVSLDLLKVRELMSCP